MAKISAHIGRQRYSVSIIAPSGNSIISDEPVSDGGQGAGLTPTELLAASLGACTAATLRMYADRKGWDMAVADIAVELQRDELLNKTTITRSINLRGNLGEVQKARLLSIANNCPVHKILSHTIEIHTRLTSAEADLPEAPEV